VTTRSASGRAIFYRRVGILAAAMGAISFALGFLLHPMI
jgi:hypothetical protein